MKSKYLYKISKNIQLMSEVGSQLQASNFSQDLFE